MGPYLSIDLDKIEHNARTLVALCAAHGLEVAGVTKCVCGHPEIAAAMLRGGVSMLADSRLENLRRMRAAGIAAPFMLLRIPALSAVEAVLEVAELSLNSELAVLEALSAAARRRGRTHEAILMVDLGDLREGVWPDELLPLVKRVERLPGIRIAGLGTNLACLAGGVPSAANMERLVALARQVEARCGAGLRWISGVNSSGLELLAAGAMPPGVNQARLGEAILLGRETTHRRPWPGTFQDAFVLHAEVLERRRKPSVPLGERGEDAFGATAPIEDRGRRDRALLNVGREDVDPAGLLPLDPRLRVLGASSGYLVVDATESALRVGEEVAFGLRYGALLAAMTSEYVHKRTLRGGGAGAARDG